MVNVSVSMQAGTANVVFHGSVFVGAAHQSNIEFERKLATAGDVGAAAMHGIIDVTSANTDVDVRYVHDNGGAVDLTVTHSSLTLVYLGET
jgi:hypothetical protein